MIIHVCRVQESNRRTWWIQGERSEIDLIKCRNNLTKSIHTYQEVNAIDRIDKMIKYKGVCSPAEAAATLGFVVTKFRKDHIT